VGGEVFGYKDKSVFQIGRRRALFAIGAVLAVAVSRPFRAFATGESTHAMGQDEFIVVGNWVMLKQDLL